MSTCDWRKVRLGRSGIEITPLGLASSYGIGARDVVLYLIDYEQSALVPVPGDAVGRATPLSVAGTVAGRAFSSTAILRSKGGDVPGQQRLYLPLLDGTERLGVIGMSFAEGALSEPIVAACERYAHLVAMLIVTKRAYGDSFEVIRRRQRMTIASELVWALVPPLVFATDGLTLAGMLEPALVSVGVDTERGGVALECPDQIGNWLPVAAGLLTQHPGQIRHTRGGAVALRRHTEDTLRPARGALPDLLVGQRDVPQLKLVIDAL